MKVEGSLFLFYALFFVPVTIVYWVLSGDPTGTTALVLTFGLSAMVGYYLWFTARRMEARPEDRPDAEISEGEGEIGFFSPHSWWPISLAASFAIVGLGLVFGVWVGLIGFGFLLISVFGFLFEYYLGVNRTQGNTLWRSTPWVSRPRVRTSSSAPDPSGALQGSVRFGGPAPAACGRGLPRAWPCQALPVLTIGLLGGMSWESTAEYHRLANQLVRDRLGGLHSARLVLVAVDFAEVAALQHAGRWDEAGALLARAARRVEAAGADLLLICTNTMHVVADQVAAAVDIPLLHLVDVTAAAVRAAGQRTVGLLGTAFTMGEPFYRDRLAGHGLTALVPAPADRELVHRTIYDELCRGVVSPSSRVALLAVVGRLAERGAEGVVLGCTELELLLTSEDTDVPLFPTTRLHVEAAVALALQGTAAATRQRPLPDLFHVAQASEWASTPYVRSTRGLDLADVGFVHCAFAWQVQGVLDRFYADADGPLLLLRLDPGLLTVPVRVEPPEGSTEGFPHLYGPLTRAAVVEEMILTASSDGWQTPPLL